MESFLAPKANIDLKLGGTYEIYFDLTAKESERGNEGCKVLSFLPNKMLSFEWIAPPSLPEARTQKTFVVIEFTTIGKNITLVKLQHLGWQQGQHWDEAYNYFDKAWQYVLTKLEQKYQK